MSQILSCCCNAPLENEQTGVDQTYAIGLCSKCHKWGDVYDAALEPKCEDCDHDGTANFKRCIGCKDHNRIEEGDR